jgi:hypothetical protein
MSKKGENAGVQQSDSGSKPFTDAELLDALELYIKREPLVLWFGNVEFPAPGTGLSGLSLLGGQRSLRKALYQIARGETR